MSSAVRAAVIESLPEGVSPQEPWRLAIRGLPEPIDLFQVDAADLPADFLPTAIGHCCQLADSVT
jgi:hypothetical protein